MLLWRCFSSCCLHCTWAPPLVLEARLAPAWETRAAWAPAAPWLRAAHPCLPAGRRWAGRHRCGAFGRRPPARCSAAGPARAGPAGRGGGRAGRQHALRSQPVWASGGLLPCRSPMQAHGVAGWEQHAKEQKAGPGAGNECGQHCAAATLRNAAVRHAWQLLGSSRKPALGWSRTCWAVGRSAGSWDSIRSSRPATSCRGRGGTGHAMSRRSMRCRPPSQPQPWLLPGSCRPETRQLERTREPAPAQAHLRALRWHPGGTQPAALRPLARNDLPAGAGWGIGLSRCGACMDITYAAVDGTVRHAGLRR